MIHGIKQTNLVLLLVFLFYHLDTSAFASVPPRPDHMEMRLEKADGTIFRLGDYKGKVILLYFWGTSCEECRWEMRELDNLQKSYPDKINVISVYTDSDNPEKREKNKVYNFDVIDKYKAIIKARYIGHNPYYDTRNLPLAIIYDKNGRYVIAFQGVVEWQNLFIREALEKLM